MKRLLITLTTLVGSLIVAVYSAELILRVYRHVISPRYDITALDGSYVAFDSALGWRLTPNTTGRSARIVNGRLLYHARFQTNNSGYLSSMSYTDRKPAGEFRICNLGDSFTAGIFLERPFSTQMQALLHERGMTQTAVYNLGITGAGMLNWHQQIKLELDQFACDLVILNVFYEDLDRPYIFFADRGADLMLGTYATIPPVFRPGDQPANLRIRGAIHPGFRIDTAPDGHVEFEPALDRYTERVYGLRDFATLRSVRASVWETFRDRLVPRVAEWAAGRQLAALAAPADSMSCNLMFASQYICERALELLDTADQAPYEFVISEIPSRNCIIRDSQRCAYNRARIRWLAQRHGFLFHPALSDFKEVAEDLEQYWAATDDHFNQRGADLYAGSLADFALSRLWSTAGSETDPPPPR